MDNKLYDNNNFACKLRDKLWALIISKKTTLKFLEDNLENLDIPNKYFPDINDMCQHNFYCRYTDPVEQILRNYVISFCVKQVLYENAA